MSRVRVRLEQYKAEIEEKSQYKHEFLGRAPDIVNTLLSDLEQDEKENGWIPVSERLPEASGTYQVTCMDGRIHRSTYAKFQSNLLNFYSSKVVTYRDNEKTLCEASEIVEDEEKIKDAVKLVRIFAEYPDRTALTESFIKSLKLLADTVESQLEEVK